MPGPDDSAPVPHAMPGPRTPREKALSLTIAASFLAASSLGLGRAPAPIPAPSCAPGDVRSGNVPWDDPHGCWEQGPDGRRWFRTRSGGFYQYHPAPPPSSRYSAPTSSRWGAGSSPTTGPGYRGSGGAGG